MRLLGIVPVLTFAAMAAFMLSPPGRADGIGLTLDRGRVLQSCATGKGDRCGYLVMFGYQRLSTVGTQAEHLPEPLREALPSPLKSLLSGPTSLQQEKCPLPDLSRFVEDVLNDSRGSGGKAVTLARVPQDMNPCFRKGKSEPTFSLIAANGALPGFVRCVPDHEGVGLCEIMFTRARVAEPVEDRISIGPLRQDEVIELLSRFPTFPLTGASEPETEFLQALAWIGDVLSPGLGQAGLGE